MESARILIAMANEASVGKLKTILSESGYIVVDSAKDGNECIRKLRTLRPDLAIIEYNLPLMNGYEVAKVSVEDNICDIVLVVGESQRNSIDDLEGPRSFICMPKPLNKSNLIITIDLMVKNRKKIVSLENEIKQLKDVLDTRKEVERAKGLLMKQLNLTEAEAFKRIQKQSMDRGIPMKEIAKAIILAYDI
ncbi:MAG: ANTAR domain-containing protein [Bacillota bacterium]|nr:ANTAR domain-containing protein [Bacillota bacterium]